MLRPFIRAIAALTMTNRRSRSTMGHAERRLADRELQRSLQAQRPVRTWRRTHQDIQSQHEERRSRSCTVGVVVPLGRSVHRVLRSGPCPRVDARSAHFSEESLEPLPGFLGGLLPHLLGVGLGLLLAGRRGLVRARSAEPPSAPPRIPPAALPMSDSPSTPLQALPPASLAMVSAAGLMSSPEIWGAHAGPFRLSATGIASGGVPSLR